MKQRCRCCLTANANAYFDIFEQHKSGTTYADNIRFLAEVQIDHKDGLSQQICSNCSVEVQRIHEFCLKVRDADEKLRQELEAAKTRIEDDQMESIQVLDSEHFAPVDDDGMEECVVEEILEQENDQENVLVVEEIHDVEEINIVEVLDSLKDQEAHSYSQKENLLESLAQVAATQKNVNIDIQCVNSDAYLPEDESDEDYLIEVDTNGTNKLKDQKWKCVECKIVLRGDVSYEGHMNIHRQLRPYACELCQSKYRCRTALKRHKYLKHSFHIKNEFICMICKKIFNFENILYLHQAIVHGEGDKCPFECIDINGNNLRQHLESIHGKEFTETFYYDDNYISPTYQCLRCSETFPKLAVLRDHFKLCQIMEEETLQNDNEINENIEIIKMEGAEVFEQCNICARKLLKKNFNKHMELHKRKEQEDKVLDDTKSFLCSFCPREFKNSKSLYQHEKIHHHDKDSDIVYICGDCERQYASQYLLDIHRKQAHKERDNICKICGNAFKLRNQLVNHMKLHLEKNIPCPHCDKKYARQFDLNVHLRSHTGEQPYACHLCEKRFAIKVRLTYHLQKHYGVKHYCKECGAAFNSKQKLKAHSFKHTGMPYRCQMCDDHGFATRNTFKRHLTRVHHTSIPEEALNEMFQRNTGKSVNIKQIDEQNLVLTAGEDDNPEDVEVLGK